MNNPDIQDRLHDLLIARATTGLSVAEAAELAALTRDSDDASAQDFEALVAALTLATGERRHMPAGLRERILASVPVAKGARPAPMVSAARPAAGGMASAGWWAAAASLLLAVAGWWPRLVGDGALPATAVADAASSRTALLNAPGTVKVALAPGPGAGDTALTGDVVFDPATQRGYLLFRGIPANDPRLSRYQLWIADKSRTAPEPVDGGVFDVQPQATATGDVIIPFSAKLPVGAPAAFVVTVEQPAGVVVSKQEKVLAIGAVPAGA